jgi:tetratricopeptide (TPR) repeat protein
MRAILSRLFILLLILGLILAPAYFSALGEIRRAESDLAAGRPLDAVAPLEHASLLLFWRADLSERAGRAAFAGRDVSNAARILSQAESLSADGWRDLGAAYFELERYEESTRVLQRGLEVYEDSATLHRQLALTFNAQGDFESEMGALQKYLTLDPGEAAAHHRLGLLLSIYDPNSAYDELNAAAQLDAAYEPSMQTMISALNLASIQKEEASGLVAIGRGLGLISEWQLAHEAFQRAADADGENAQAWAWLGEANQHIGQDGGEALARAVRLNPFDASVRALYGLYWKRMEEPQKALTQFQWAAAIEQDSPAYQAALADAFTFAGDLPSALTTYLRAIELAPNEATYWRLLAVFSTQYSYRVTEFGIPAAQQALALAPDEAASYDLLGLAYLASDLPVTAGLNFRLALELDENYAPAYLHLGMLYLEANEMENARAHLLRALELDPNGAQGQAAAKLLELYFP